MSASAGLIYEVTLNIDPEDLESFDSWHADHIEEMLAIAGFTDAHVFTLEDAPDGRARRVTHYHLESESHLQQYLADQATTMQQAGIDRFGDGYSASRRILHEGDVTGGSLKPTEICLNCHAQLAGQYCGNCGQRARSRLISLWELVSEAFGDLFELDSRLWSTMRPLLLRPGKLTSEYLRGRRARFMPPFRTYLVLSIIFLLVFFFNPKEDFSFLYESTIDTTEEAIEKEPTPDEIRDELRADLAADGLIPPATSEEEESVVEEDGESNGNEPNKAWDGLGVTITTDDSDPDDEGLTCDFEELENLGGPDWLARRLTPERLVLICEKIYADDGKALWDKMRNNIPAALFFLLPLMAFVLKLLYPLSKRYYVEHLLFVVHYHAFFFLILILQMLLSRVSALLRVSETAVGAALFAISLYIPVYLYKSMRHVYNQGHAATVPKYIGLVLAYAVGMVSILLVTILLAAFSI